MSRPGEGFVPVVAGMTLLKLSMFFRDADILEGIHSNGRNTSVRFGSLGVSILLK